MVETIVIIVLCLVVAGVAIAFASAILKRRKKQKAKLKASQKSADADSETSPQQDAASQPEQFKITKKTRLSRISRKALKADSRTVGTPTIEPVYARTPDAPEQTSDVVVDQRLSVESEQFIQSLGSANTDGRQVVSLGDLKKEQQQASAEQQASTQGKDDEWSSGQGLKKDLWSSMNARDLNVSPIINEDFHGHFRGNYTGIKVGAEGKQADSNATMPKPKDGGVVDFASPSPNTGWQDASSGFNTPNSSSFMGASPFFTDSPFGRPVMPGSSANNTKQQKFDIGDAVVAEAILNRKGKPLKKDKPDK